MANPVTETQGNSTRSGNRFQFPFVLGGGRQRCHVHIDVYGGHSRMDERIGVAIQDPLSRIFGLRQPRRLSPYAFEGRTPLAGPIRGDCTLVDENAARPYYRSLTRRQRFRRMMAESVVL